MGFSASSRFIFPTNSGVLAKKEQLTSAKYNATINYLLSSLNSLDGEEVGAARFFQASTFPVWVSNLTFSVATILCRDSSNQYWMYNPTTSTVDVSTTGLNGVAAGSSNLAGTITAAGTNITGVGTAFLTDFVVGDIVWVNSTNASRITGITTNTAMTTDKTIVAAGVSYRRGGKLTELTSAGTVGFYVYVISNGTNVGLICSTRDVSSGDTLVDLPSGYTRYRQLPFYVIGTGIGTNALRKWRCDGGWPYCSRVLYTEADNATFGAVAASSATGAQTTNMRVGIPRFSRVGLFKVWVSSATVGPLTLTIGELAGAEQQTFNFTGNATATLATMGPWAEVAVAANGDVNWANSGSTTNVTNIYPKGYIVTNNL